MSRDVLGRRGLVLRRYKGRKFQAGAKGPKMEMNSVFKEQKEGRCIWRKINREEAGRKGNQRGARLRAVVKSLALLSVMGSAWVVCCRG